MMFRNFSLLALSFTAPSAASPYRSDLLAFAFTAPPSAALPDRADLTKLGRSGVSGPAISVSNGLDGTAVGYAGFASGLAASFTAADCPAKNGWGVQVHAGASCVDNLLIATTEEKNVDEQETLGFGTQMHSSPRRTKNEMDHGGGSFASQLHRASEITMRGRIRRRSSWLRSLSIRQRSEIASNSIGVKELCEDPDFDTIPEGFVDETDSQMNGEPFVLDPIFESKFAPEEMRCLALVAHNHMKPAMKDFVKKNLNLLKKFRLTGTETTMMMLREVLGDEHMNKYGGPVCKSGPLGGDAELVAQMCADTMGAIFFFQDPMDSHPHSADIECLCRQTNVHNLIVCTNPTSAHAMTFGLRQALKTGDTSMAPSFFFSCESPSVKEYKARQAAVLLQNRLR